MSLAVALQGSLLPPPVQVFLLQQSRASGAAAVGRFASRACAEAQRGVGACVSCSSLAVAEQGQNVLVEATLDDPCLAGKAS